jgi:hypothetical protein
LQSNSISKSLPKAVTRETRKGWPLLTVETGVNGDSKNTNEMVLPWLFRGGLSCQYKRFLFYLGCSSRPSTKHFFSLNIIHYISILLSPSPSKYEEDLSYMILRFS